MKSVRSNLQLVVGILLSTGVLLWASSPLAAADAMATFSLTPADGSYTVGNTLAVAVHEDSGLVQVNAVDTNLAYDQSKLDFLGIDTKGSAFDLTVVASGGNGTVKLARAKAGTTLTGSRLVATINFKVLASGNATVSLLNSGADSSHIAAYPSKQDAWDHQPAAATYTLTGTATSSGPTDRSTTNATGYLAAIKVVDTKGEIVTNATVKLDGKTAETDSTGVAGFNDVKAGAYTLEVTAKGVHASQPFAVESSASPAAQSTTVTLNLASHTLANKPLTTIVLVVLLLGLALYLSMKRQPTVEPKVDEESKEAE